MHVANKAQNLDVAFTTSHPSYPQILLALPSNILCICHVSPSLPFSSQSEVPLYSTGQTTAVASLLISLHTLFPESSAQAILSNYSDHLYQNFHSPI